MGVDRLVERDWTQVRETVIAVLDARGLDEVAVLIRKDVDSRPEKLVGDWDPQSPLGVQDCRPDPGLGSSINNSRAAGDVALGTLGAWVEVQELATGDWVPMALTSANCCLPPEEGLSAEDVQVLQQWKRDGVNSNNVHKRHLLAVESPSRKDVEQGIQFLTDEINQPGLEPNGRSAQMRVEWRKDRETMKGYLDNDGNLLGEVFASSGLRVAPSTEDASKLSIRDWALVQPNADHSMGKNDIEIVRTAVGRELGRLYRYPPTTDQSLWTIGRNFNVRWEYANLKVYHISRPTAEGTKPPILTWEHAMIRNGHIGPLGDERDSGALVLDQVGWTRGMVFGGSMSGDLVYFTSARDLVDDINRSGTGSKAVRVPGDEFWEWE
ncbi:hypothetical protein BJX62DRAFT_245590 [Aspergillus germanicus]